MDWQSNNIFGIRETSASGLEVADDYELGTTNATPVSIWTNNVKRVEWDTDGRHNVKRRRTVAVNGDDTSDIRFEEASSNWDLGVIDSKFSFKRGGSEISSISTAGAFTTASVHCDTVKPKTAATALSLVDKTAGIG